MFFIKLPRGVERVECGLVVLQLKRGLANVVMRHRRRLSFRKFLQELAKCFAHPLWVLLLAKQKRFVLQRFLALVRTGIFGNDRVPIGERAVVILIGLKRFSSSRVSGRGKRAVRKRLHEKSERLDDSVNFFHLKITGTELIGGFGAKFRRKLRRAQLGKDGRRAWIILLFVKGLGLEKFRLIGPFRGR